MQKSALSVMSTDWHIKPNNTEQIIDLIKQQIEKAKKLQTTNLICLGDVFQSRQAQPLITLKCFEQILDLIHQEKMVLYCIAGNHDKTNYSSEDSFLDQFSWHPALHLVRVYEGTFALGDIKFWFLPYFENDTWLERVNKIIKSVKNQGESKHILLSHQAFEGSVNNDGSKVTSPVKISMFKVFFKVFLGHYHNQHQLGKNIFHIPSLQANNFGEDNEKGFTVLYSDGSHELINSKFPEYHTIKVDLDKVDKKDINNLKKQASELIKESGYNVKFKIEGSEDKVQSLNSEEFEVLGIKVNKEHKSAVKAIEKAETGEVITYNDETILDKFDKFCKSEDYNHIDYGKKLLIKKLKNG